MFQSGYRIRFSGGGRAWRGPHFPPHLTPPHATRGPYLLELPSDHPGWGGGAIQRVHGVKIKTIFSRCVQGSGIVSFFLFFYSKETFGFSSSQWRSLFRLMRFIEGDPWGGGELNCTQHTHTDTKRKARISLWAPGGQD